LIVLSLNTINMDKWIFSIYETIIHEVVSQIYYDVYHLNV
jgi:hypothetical protein